MSNAVLGDLHMTIYRQDGTVLPPPGWPIERAVHPMPEVPNLKFEREGNCLVIRSAGDGVSLDEPSIRAIGAMMMRLADDIRADHDRRSFVPNH